MHIVLALAAEAANLTEDSRINVLGIFHRILVTALPASIPRLAIAVEICLEPFDKGHLSNLDIRLLDPDGKLIYQIDNLGFEVPSDDPFLTPIVPLVVSIDSVTFPVAGAYRFEIHLDGESRGEIPLEIMQANA